MWLDFKLAYLTSRMYSTEARGMGSTCAYLGVGWVEGREPWGEGSLRKG